MRARCACLVKQEFNPCLLNWGVEKAVMSLFPFPISFPRRVVVCWCEDGGRFHSAGVRTRERERESNLDHHAGFPIQVQLALCIGAWRAKLEIVFVPCRACMRAWCLYVRSDLGENPLSLFPFWAGICSLFPLPIQLRLALSVMGCCSVVSASAAIIGDMCVCSLQGSEACVCCQDRGSQHREVPLLCLGSFARIHY